MKNWKEIKELTKILTSSTKHWNTPILHWNNGITGFHSVIMMPGGTPPLSLSSSSSSSSRSWIVASVWALRSSGSLSTGGCLWLMCPPPPPVFFFPGKPQNDRENNSLTKRFRFTTPIPECGQNGSLPDDLSLISRNDCSVFFFCGPWVSVGLENFFPLFVDFVVVRTGKFWTALFWMMQMIFLLYVPALFPWSLSIQYNKRFPFTLNAWRDQIWEKKENCVPFGVGVHLG